MTRPVEELLFHWPAVVRTASKGWPADFARSIASQSRRRNWRPSPKQRDLMQRMVSELFTNTGEDDFQVIE
ncbi:hypothetical protein [Tropicimonas isoalkanivorans]|uniref:Uncharacterized protein n=1 Tax=Tropicimonas isoalkanivorans TaxID=441112 RepID=A0A1I1M840_9RHOB|nr:hypothetical protein [Tropicimonas isoalkanivorans]SFC77830.1 hypothetical protein SAMN04488094_10964 [Tropicimonas isoalkanivorans]